MKPTISLLIKPTINLFFLRNISSKEDSRKVTVTNPACGYHKSVCIISDEKKHLH